MMDTFGKIPEELGSYENAAILLQSLPYDGTSTWGKGSDKAFQAILDAADHMELYDIETDSEVYLKGIHMLPEADIDCSPEAFYKQTLELSRKMLESGKFPTFIGGEHAVSIGVIEAFREKYPGLTVLQLDAHTDLREEYLGSSYNHACALHRASKNTHLIQVGIRSMDINEKPFFKRENCYFAEEMADRPGWIEESIARMTEQVYITVDLDVFDPSIMPATGTPEPGGMDWNTVISYLRKVFQAREVVGFDMVELAPRPEFPYADFLAAKLYYKMLSYKYYG